jgi:surfactin synthase thioesterase subunit
VNTSDGAVDLIASFPAAGAGGTTLEQLEKLAVRRGMAYVALANPASIDALVGGAWQAESIDQLRRAVDQASASRVLLVGHCMGGLSAVRLSDGLGAMLARPVRVLVVNTPCPDPSGRIPTMSGFSDAEIAEVLLHDGFPPEVLEDEEMLAEVADGLREDATVADRLAEWVNSADHLDTLYVLSTRGDRFIPPEQCAGWRHRVSGEFHLTITDGGHTLDETTIGVLDRAIDSAMAAAQTELV